MTNTRLTTEEDDDHHQQDGMNHHHHQSPEKTAESETFLTSDESFDEEEEDDGDCGASIGSTCSSSSSSSSTSSSQIVPLIDVTRHFQERIKYSYSSSCSEDNNNNDDDDDDDAEEEEEVDLPQENSPPLPSTEDNQVNDTDNEDSFDDDKEEEGNVDRTRQRKQNQQRRQEHSYRVQFDPTVVGVNISHHSDYPEPIRRRLWNSFAEIQTNAERNIAEFRADGWEWRNATEEDDMLVVQTSTTVNKDANGCSTDACPQTTSPTADLVHPASFKTISKDTPGASKKRKMARSKSRLSRRQRARHC